ncbi:MAG: DUF1064 domain-containing protein [Caldilineaceae bacterium]|nr:DUF1064 domain-containing protein [Caldilineaceae bacterium]
MDALLKRHPDAVNAAASEALKPRRKPKKHKHNAQRSEVDGVKYDSGGERQRHQVLMQWEMAGVICNLELKPRYVVQEKFRYRGQSFPAMTYTPDFRYVMTDTGQEVVEDWKKLDRKTGKPYITKDFSARIKMFLYRYPNVNMFVNTQLYGRYEGQLYGV